MIWHQLQSIPRKNLARINDTFFQKLFKKQSEFGGKLFQNGKQCYKKL
jgi:hypothetical protein